MLIERGSLTVLQLFYSSHVALVAENLFLRRQRTLFQERKANPRRTTASSRLAMVALAEFFGWGDALVLETFSESSRSEGITDSRSNSWWSPALRAGGRIFDPSVGGIR